MPDGQAIHAAGDAPLLRMEGIAKSFPGVVALAGVDLELRRGEVLALLGENGAGKSTLIKVLAGAHAPDAGRILLDGREVSIPNPLEARRLGIAVMHQELSLVPQMSVRENLFLGREPSRLGFVSIGEERRRASELLGLVGVGLDVEARCRDLTVAQQQAVEIARALSQDARVLVMDEPTAALTPAEAERLFDVIADLRGRGIGILYVSHRLDEVFRIAGRATVLRDGRLVGSRPIRETTRGEIIEMMVGRKLEGEYPRRSRAPGPVRLACRDLRRGTKVRGVSFDVRAGEVLGITGQVGAGRTELARLIFGADRLDAGTIALDGRELRIEHPRQAIAAGICLLTEDRKGQGLVLALGSRENFGLPNLRDFAAAGFVRHRAEASAFDGFARGLSIRLASPDAPVRNLSGGNQQKVVLAKWLQRNAEVILFDEPTRGIDVGAKREIYGLIDGLAAAGKAIVMISSELPEVLGMSDRILVMHEGRVTGEVTEVASATQAQIMSLAVR